MTAPQIRVTDGAATNPAAARMGRGRVRSEEGFFAIFWSVQKTNRAGFPPRWSSFDQKRDFLFEITICGLYFKSLLMSTVGSAT